MSIYLKAENHYLDNQCSPIPLMTLNLYNIMPHLLISYEIMLFNYICLLYFYLTIIYVYVKYTRL